MNLHKTFYYCSECMHVYFDLPSSKECAICHNEMSEKNVITDLDILICETCNHIYTIQFPDELIPPYENNIHNLCGCKNKCPTTAFLAVGEQQSYYGNILKADIYRCQNCGAITFRNMGTQKKSCYECGSKYLEPLHWDSSANRIIYQCANPNHGIRLKLRDLIANNNNIIDEKIKQIQIAEVDLQKRYQIQLHAINNEFSGGALKKQWHKLQGKLTPQELKIKQLNNWAFQERKKLYTDLYPLGLRCAVFQEQPGDLHPILIKTSDGCGALAQIKIKKVVIAPDGTIIDSEPKIIQEPAEDKQEDDFSTISNQDQQINRLDQNHESIFTTILRMPSQEIDDNINNIKTDEKSDLENATSVEAELESIESQELAVISLTDEILEDLPTLQPNQVFLIVFLMGRKKSEKNFHLLNHGIMPLEFSSDDEEPVKILVGKEHFIGMYWKNLDVLSLKPYYFENILPIGEKTFHFAVIKEKLDFFVEPNSLNFELSIKNKDSPIPIQVTKKMPLQNYSELQFSGYYSMLESNPDEYHELQFKIIFIKSN
ncbi:MAG: hypothetical protein K9W44_02500 [Candidatus Lokiarchaeota archaeon]|nr:hypothetical protein [Candidatus Harpocratesius repetitus]